MKPTSYTPDAVVLDEGTLPEEYDLHERAMAKMFTMQDYWQAFRRNPLLVSELQYTAAEQAEINRQAQESAQAHAALGISMIISDGMDDSAFRGTEPPTDEMRQWACDRLAHHYYFFMQDKKRRVQQR